MQRYLADEILKISISMRLPLIYYFTFFSGVVNKMLLFGDFLFTTAYDSTIVCWNVTNGESTRVYKGHTKNVLPIAYIEGPDHDSNGMSNIDCNKDAIVTGMHFVKVIYCFIK